MCMCVCVLSAAIAAARDRVQGLIKIEETTVEVFCRPADLAAVKGCVQAAVKEYVSLMRQEAGLSLKLTVTVNEKPAKMLPTTW